MKLPMTRAAGWILLLVIVGLTAPSRAQDRPAPVGVDAVRTEPLEQTKPVLGRLVPRQQGPVATQVEGAVAALPVRVGDRVQTGDVLAELDAQRLTVARDVAQATLDAAGAERRTAQARLQLAQQELARLERLRSSAAFSAAQFEDKGQEIEVARAELLAAEVMIGQTEVQLTRAERDLADAVVRAPYPGVVLTRETSPGAYVRPGDPIVTMLDDSLLEIEADVPANLIAGLTPERTITATINNDQPFEAAVRAVLPDENPLTRTRAVRLVSAVLNDNQSGLAAGQSVAIDVPLGARRDVLTVDKDAVLQRQGGNIVYLVGEENSAQIRPVTLGVAVGGRFEVLGGLAPGDLVVVRGNERLRPGQNLQFEPPASVEPADPAVAGTGGGSNSELQPASASDAPRAAAGSEQEG